MNEGPLDLAVPCSVSPQAPPSVSVSFRHDPDCRLPKECLGPIQPNCLAHRLQLVRTGWTGCGKPGCTCLYLCTLLLGLLVRVRQGMAGRCRLAPRLCDAAPDVCSRFRLQPAPSAASQSSQPVRPQPNSSSSAQASFITRCTINASITSIPDTHYNPCGILTSSSFRQSSPGRRLWTCTLSKPRRLPTFQPANLQRWITNSQAFPTTPSDLLPKDGISLAASNFLPHHTTKYLTQHGYTRTSWRPRHGQPIRAVQTGPAWYVPLSRVAEAEAWVGACANNAAGESAVGKVLPFPVAIKHHAPSSSLTRHPRAP